MKYEPEEMSFSGYLAYQMDTLLLMYEEHLQQWDGELLPYLWMADIAEAVVGGRIFGSELAWLLAVLDRELGQGRPGAQNLIAVSFVEHLPIPARGGQKLIKGFNSLESQYRVVFGC